MSVKERIKEFCKAEGIPVSAFESSIGASNGYVNAISKSIGIDRLNTLVEKYSNINIEWLLTGKGEMLKAQPSAVERITDIGTHTHNNREAINSKADKHAITEKRPRIPLTAAAGTLSIALDSVRESDCDMIPIIPTLPKYDFTIVARGDSMEPDVISGDELACRFINEQQFIQWGRTHVLDTAQGIIVKRIFDNGECITCHSSNSFYPDIYISKEEIHHIALVVGLIRQY